MQIKELIKPANWWRFAKKSVFFAVVVSLVGMALDWIIKFLGYPVLNSVMDIKNLSGFAIVIGILDIAITYLIVGFLIEFTNDGKGNFIKWLNK